MMIDVRINETKLGFHVGVCREGVNRCMRHGGGPGSSAASGPHHHPRAPAAADHHRRQAVSPQSRAR